MNKKKIIKRKILATFFFSLISSIGLIIHGVFFDLDFSQIERLTIGGFALTFILVLSTLLILEKIFDLENHEEFVELERRVKELEKRNKRDNQSNLNNTLS
jgi:amino acid transporter